MLKTAIAAAMLFPAFAYGAPLTCEQMAGLAEKIMEARQSGVPMANMVKIAETSDMGEPERDFMRGATVMAYEKTAWRTDEAQKRAIAEFGNGIMVACIKNR